jgi:hypothetical protein
MPFELAEKKERETEAVSMTTFRFRMDNQAGWQQPPLAV